MELSVGMYVRTELYSISKIIYIEDTNWLEIDKNKGCLIHDETVLKASHNIIDLIEVGDYVNGHKVLEVYEDRIKFGEDDLVLARRSNYDNYYLYFEDIKSIVTKEQYESMSYKVGE